MKHERGRCGRSLSVIREREIRGGCARRSWASSLPADTRRSSFRSSAGRRCLRSRRSGSYSPSPSTPSARPRPSSPRSERCRPPRAGRFFFVRTSGEPLALNHAAVLAPRRILQKKGYRVAGDLHYVMPYNIIFRHTDGMAARMWETVVRRLPADAAAIEAGSGRLPRVGLFGRAAALAVRIEQPAMPLIGRGVFRFGGLRGLRGVRGALSRAQYPHGGRKARVRRALHGVHGVRVFLSEGRGAHGDPERLARQRRIRSDRAARGGRGDLPLLQEVLSALFPQLRIKEGRRPRRSRGRRPFIALFTAGCGSGAARVYRA